MERYTVCCRRIVTLLLCGIIYIFSSACQNKSSKSIIVDSAGIACADSLAANAGLHILRQGGNAVDALVTVATTMAVTYPRAGNIGGGGFLLYRSADGQVNSIDFRETAPQAATVDMYWDEQGKPVEEKSRYGALASGIPGTVKGLYLAHQKYGSLPWKDLLQSAIKFAEAGFAINQSFGKLLKKHEEKFRQFPESYRIFFPESQLLKPGDTLRQADLARTLQLIADHGEDVLYNGPLADKIVATVRKYGGIFTNEDFAEYQAIERNPIRISYRDYVLYSMPPPSSGGLVLKGIFNTLVHIQLSDTFSHNSADYVAFFSEVEKQWYAHRNLYLGDPDFVDLPYHIFTSADTAARIAQNIDIHTPNPSRHFPEFSYMENPLEESTETTHISIVDENGNAVAMTYTLNGSFGSHLVADGTGILLNNQMDDFTAKPGYPNMYGLVQGEANKIEPKKRMLSSMSPTLVEQNGEFEGALGTPGGSTIITSVLQVVLNKIDYRMTLPEALEAGRFHHQWLPDSIYCEKKYFPETVLNELRRRGFAVSQVDRLADIQAIWRSGDRWEICSDPRGTGTPVGY